MTPQRRQPDSIAGGEDCPRASRGAGAPPGPRRRTLRAGQILDAASALFVEKGPCETSIDDIVERAGVAKGTFYHYFRDRAAMLEGLRGRYSQAFADAAQCAVSAVPGECWAARLDAWVAATVEAYASTLALHDALFHDATLVQRCVMSEEPFVRYLADLLAHGAAADARTLADPLTTAVFLFHGLHGVADETIARGDDAMTAGPAITAMFRAAVRGS